MFLFFCFERNSEIIRRKVRLLLQSSHQMATGIKFFKFHTVYLDRTQSLFGVSRLPHKPLAKCLFSSFIPGNGLLLMFTLSEDNNLSHCGFHRFRTIRLFTNVYLPSQYSHVMLHVTHDIVSIDEKRRTCRN